MLNNTFQQTLLDKQPTIDISTLNFSLFSIEFDGGFVLDWKVDDIIIVKVNPHGFDVDC